MRILGGDRKFPMVTNNSRVLNLALLVIEKRSSTRMNIRVRRNYFNLDAAHTWKFVTLRQL